MIGDKMFDCREMFRHACAFCECADMAFEKYKHETADIEFYSTPAVVNAAFACEVFCKALLKYDDIPYKKVHKLADLYNKLPNDIKDCIKSIVIYKYGKWKDNFGFDCLDNISNVFAKWRYIFEHDWSESASIHLQTGFLFAFRDALREICCQLFYYKSWEQYKK